LKTVKTDPIATKADQQGGQKADQNVEPGADFHVFEVHGRSLFFENFSAPWHVAKDRAKLVS
jgi:hypothetical protein